MSRLAARLRERATPVSTVTFDLSEEPVPLTEFITGKRYMNNMRLGERQYRAVRYMEQIFYPSDQKQLTELWREDPVDHVTEIILQWGKGSGKDHVSRIGSARVAYLLCCLRSPQAYFGIPEQDYIHLLNVASSAPQAFRGFFDPLKNIVQRKDSWFERNGVRAVKDTITFPKNVEAISGHSDAETQEGLNLIFGVADEISAFKTAAETSVYNRGNPRESQGTAEAVMEMMRTSSGSRFPAGNAKVVAISFPRYKGDAIQTLTNEARARVAERGQAAMVYVDGPAATWEVNPRVTSIEDSPVIAEAYRKDPEAAAAKYECKPRSSASPWFRNEDAVDEAFAGSGDVSDPFQVSYHYGVDPDGVGRGWQTKVWLDPVRVRPITGALYAMHCDLAVTADRAGIAMCHVKAWTDYSETNLEGEKRRVESRPIIKVDFVGSFESDMTETPVPREIRIAWARELCYELQRRGFNVKLMTFDGFQSTDSMQQLRARGIESYRVSTDMTNEPMNTMKELIYEGRLEAYYRKVVMDEIKALTQLRNGRIDHPPGGSKDEADALAGAIMGALELGGQETGTVIDPWTATPEMPMTIHSFMPTGMGDWGDVL